MEHNHSTLRRKGVGWWWKLIAGGGATLVLIYFVSPVFLFIVPMLLMHMFGHGGGHHSHNRNEPNDIHGSNPDIQEGHSRHASVGERSIEEQEDHRGHDSGVDSHEEDGSHGGCC